VTLFSLITVTRDNLAGLRATWASVEAQGCDDYEWIVVDGASADGTVDWLAVHPRADWCSAPDGGIYDAMNRGLARARGEWLAFLNAGDALAGPGVLAGLAACIAAHPGADFVYGDALEGHTDSHPPKRGGPGGVLQTARAFYKRARGHGTLARGLFTHHQAMAYRRAAVGGLRYDLRWPLAADYAFTAAFLARGARAVYWPQPVCLFAPGGASQKAQAQGRAEQYAIRAELGLAGPLANRAIWAWQAGASAARAAAPWLYRAWKR
jgi:putative colanic acid biosynthesis glycosyltransferase